MTKLKPTLLVAIALVLVLALSACGGENVPAADNNPPANTSTQEQADNTAADNGMKTTAPDDPAASEQSANEPAPEEPSAEDPAAAEAISFSAEIQPILESRCLNCHGGERIEGELVMFTYADLLAGGESGPVIIPGDADASYLAELIREQKMPKRGPKLTPVQTQLIIDWINQGALNN